jgi:hypothetical protein
LLSGPRLPRCHRLRRSSTCPCSAVLARVLSGLWRVCQFPAAGSLGPSRLSVGGGPCEWTDWSFRRVLFCARIFVRCRPILSPVLLRASRRCTRAAPVLFTRRRLRACFGCGRALCDSQHAGRSYAHVRFRVQFRVFGLDCSSEFSLENSLEFSVLECSPVHSPGRARRPAKTRTASLELRTSPSTVKIASSPFAPYNLCMAPWAVSSAGSTEPASFRTLVEHDC